MKTRVKMRMIMSGTKVNSACTVECKMAQGWLPVAADQGPATFHSKEAAERFAATLQNAKEAK